MKKSYTIVLKMETPRGRVARHPYIYKYTTYHKAIYMAKQKIAELLDKGYARVSIEHVTEWENPWF